MEKLKALPSNLPVLSCPCVLPPALRACRDCVTSTTEPSTASTSWWVLNLGPAMVFVCQVCVQVLENSRKLWLTLLCYTCSCSISNIQHLQFLGGLSLVLNLFFWSHLGSQGVNIGGTFLQKEKELILFPNSELLLFPVPFWLCYFATWKQLTCL